MKQLILFLIVFLSFSKQGTAQDLNNYRYVIVPEKFDFLNWENQFQVNALTKFLLEKYGFQAYMADEEIPEKIANDPCKGLMADVKSNSNMFTTKLKVIFKDCNNRQVFISEEGTSREKDFKTAYHDALRKAFQSINSLNYSYKPVERIASSGDKETSNKEGTANKPYVNGEVTNLTPEEKRKAQQREAVQLGEKGILEKKDLVFEMDNGVYFLEKTGNGYNFHQKEMSEPFASLISTRSKDTFIYSSITNQGVAHFDEQGNLIVEFLDKQTGSPTIKVYKRLDQ